MRILQVLHDRERGGVQTLANIVAEGLQPHGFHLGTIYLYPRPGLSTIAKLSHVLAMARRIWNGDFDALLAYQSTASILVGAVGRLAGCRLRIVHQTCALDEVPRVLAFLDMAAGACGLYSANIVNSAATWAEFARHPRPYRRSMRLIEHGLDAPVASRSRDETRRRFSLPPTPMLLNVGRLAPQKNQDLLIRALACLPGVHLAIAGAGPQASAYRTLAKTLGVDDRLHLLGALPADAIADLYAACDLFVFPSTWETFGLATVEAAMAGMPMVVADLPAVREVLRTDGAAPVKFVAAQDLESWIATIRAALASPAPPSAAFADTIAHRYSRRRMIESYLSLFTVEARRATGKSSGLTRATEEVP